MHPDLFHLRRELCRVGQSLFQRGYVHSSAGNISARVPAAAGGGMLITPSDACLGFLEPETLAWLDVNGQCLAGPPPSKSHLLHQRLYDLEPDAGCVLHTHSSHLVALSLLGGGSSDDLLPPLTPYYVMKVGHVPCIPYLSPGDPHAAHRLADTLARHHAKGLRLRAVMQERLGPTVWGPSPSAAMATLEELEETARLWLLTRGQPAPLTPEQIDDLRRRFGASW
ncbi:aldolase [Chromobacterium haemolyticum]|uniref:class II aldolase/adducin family protein n=1 Tax=Chromobacterium haemolyticum TaxID=394935 RepID=UPI000DF017EB|nr:aldolase [Chromobacterium haemolyticum]